MPNIDGWLTNSFPLSTWLSDHDMAVDTAQLIAEKSTTITIRRDGANLAAQVVRLEGLGTPSQRNGENVTVGVQQILVLGYKGHPTIADTNIRRGDRFYIGSAEDMSYEITQILPDLRDSVQAIGTAGQGA